MDVMSESSTRTGFERNALKNKILIFDQDTNVRNNADTTIDNTNIQNGDSCEYM